MRVTEKDRKIMCQLHDNFEKVITENIEICFDYIILPMGVYLGCSKDMALDLYKGYKQEGKKVYFSNAEGFWLLNSKGDIDLQHKQN